MKLSKKLSNSSHKGKVGEQAAVAYLCKIGYRILATNYRAAGAEIDIIARDHDDLVVVEVKSHHQSDEMLGEQIGTEKKQRLERAIEHFLSYHQVQPHAIRLEIVAIILTQNIVHHFREEFFDF
jgi:putative endonuclease